MKWFKHISSAHTDLALRQILEMYGVEAYGLWWICCELVAQQGVHFRLKKEKNWLKAVELITKIPEKKILEIVKSLSEVNLIDKRGLTKGDLYIPNMGKYADEYTEWKEKKKSKTPDSVGTLSQSVGLEEKRIDKIRKEKKISSFLKPFYNGMAVRESKGKLWCIPNNGSAWLEFMATNEEINKINWR